MSKQTNNRQLNCAIYTRKSTDEGLDKEFNSLDAQRECAEAYIKSQTQEGWYCVPDRYDDGGFTGGNMDRPALRQLLADIEAGKVNCVVVYKVDRLSRSLMDFARMLEVFERNQVAFVSVSMASRSCSLTTERVGDACSSCNPRTGNGHLLDPTSQIVSKRIGENATAPTAIMITKQPRVVL